jgi:hypothetical protein
MHIDFHTSLWGFTFQKKTYISVGVPLHVSLPSFTQNSFLHNKDENNQSFAVAIVSSTAYSARGSLMFLPLTEAFFFPAFFALPALSRLPSDSVYAGLYPPEPIQVYMKSVHEGTSTVVN